ncbi:MAG: hypothetical protein J1F11_06400 [Oscillospiraceae bacterium]|nr:hypothetical protein [Oscillospiraceae bacterium]
MIFETDKDFYKAVKRDYDRKTNHMDCFAYKYFKKRKDRMADKYIQNNSWVNKYIKKIDFSKLTGWSDYTKKFPRTDHPHRPDQYDLICAAYKLFNKGMIDIDKAKSVFIFIAEKKDDTIRMCRTVRNGSADDVLKEYENLSDNLLRKNVIKEYLRRRFAETSLDDINMLYEYFLYKGISSDQALSKDHTEKCRELFELLLASGSDKVFVPLYIDPSSGAGVYIIGNRYIRKRKKQLPELKNCSVYTAAFAAVERDVFSESSILLSYDLKRFENVQDAFDDFNDKNEHYESYQFINPETDDLYVTIKERFGETDFLRFFNPPEAGRSPGKESIIRTEKMLEQQEIKEKYEESWGQK